MQVSPTFRLRQASADDAPLFYSVIDRTMREFIITTWGAWNEDRVQREAYEDSRSPNAQVVEVDASPVGVFVVEKCPTHIQLEQIYLLPEYQRMGIGKALLNILISEAAQLEIPVRLRVMAVNPAKSFYERLGFVVTEVTSEFFSMEKTIDPHQQGGDSRAVGKLM
jgi:ribosomal protein S18 acetylase RimI-like enzyme